MKNKLSRCLLALIATMGLLMSMNVAQAYWCERVHGWHHGHYRAHTVCFSHHRYYRYYYPIRCEWVPGYWYRGYWHPTHRVCWR